MDATAKAKALDSYEHIAKTLKKRAREDRELLQYVRQAQAVVTGIEVETITAPGGTENGSEGTSQA